MKGLALAKAELINGNYTCVIVNNSDVVMASLERGVKPLILFYETKNNRPFDELVLADKVIGRASALLASLCGIKAIYTQIISKEARTALEILGIPVEYGKTVPYIINRNGDGRCPMEELSLGINDPYEVYLKIKNWSQ